MLKNQVDLRGSVRQDLTSQKTQAKWKGVEVLGDLVTANVLLARLNGISRMRMKRPRQEKLQQISSPETHGGHTCAQGVACEQSSQPRRVSAEILGHSRSLTYSSD